MPHLPEKAVRREIAQFASAGAPYLSLEDTITWSSSAAPNAKQDALLALVLDSWIRPLVNRPPFDLTFSRFASSPFLLPSVFSPSSPILVRFSSSFVVFLRSLCCLPSSRLDGRPLLRHQYLGTDPNPIQSVTLLVTNFRRSQHASLQRPTSRHLGGPLHHRSRRGVFCRTPLQGRASRRASLAKRSRPRPPSSPKLFRQKRPRVKLRLLLASHGSR